MDAKQHVEETLKQLEKEIVELENAQVELMRKKWALETKLEKQQQVLSSLELQAETAVKERSMWKRVALVLGVAWGIVLSFFNIDKK
jgi:predicted unusual protein kinase regulating ubiquinone biosynthesis (AarF/ABC1/UbiB family)